ncbi:NYN domain-containing protein [Streptosporangium sp. NBC_01755]|uniref:NYN domain-containing protein n=1 Tax=Streptosporangium sp. NBC_01755 TaxID=2975949 RepID=UPI002DDB8844|nr:NYN domain-containing protein [Streptosporangium sp. NBC_01755]WSD03689.1 NYN domain-containing protein [Streptosporangium sp. NBC_01755]
MDRCALFVDAGYLLADGAMAVHGTRHREAVSWDYPGLLQLLNKLSRERTGLPLLRCYWYEATVEGRRTPEHDTLADIPGLKLRLSRIRPGRREGVDAQVHRDLMTLARNGAVCDAVVVSGDEDLAQVVCDAQDLGVRVTVVHISADGSWAVSRTLRQECDDLIEIGAGQLRPHVSLIGDEAPPQAVNGHQHGTNGRSVTARGSNGSPVTSPVPAVQTPRAAHAQHALPSAYSSYTQESPVTPATPIAPPLQTPPLQTPPLQTPPLQAPPLPHASAPPHAANGSTGPLPPAPQYSLGNTGGMPSYQASQMGAYTGPQPAPVPMQSAGTGAATTLSDAVKAAHKEGHDFGESVAKDAPALWLEAVLARKPRMPSDLEARLLQGSSLPIDFLLHDEVRHALRRGFWDALERARR